LTPANSTNPLGKPHMVLATITDQFGNPQADMLVSFTIGSGPNSGAVGTCGPAACRSDSNGEVTFTYFGSGGVGVDSIVACVDNQAGQPVCSSPATKEWLAYRFRDVRRPPEINEGMDLCGTGHGAITFNGTAGPAGDTWITVYETIPS